MCQDQVAIRRSADAESSAGLVLGLDMATMKRKCGYFDIFNTKCTGIWNIVNIVIIFSNGVTNCENGSFKSDYYLVYIPDH